MSLFDRQILIVTGKGGVGRTTTAVCLALAAARRGKRVAVVEFHGMASVPEILGKTGRTYEPRAVAPGVDSFSMTAQEALDDFGLRNLRMDALVRLVFHNRVMETFLDAVPGLHDLLQLGKLRNLLEEPLRSDPHYDLVIIDAPATGHGLTLLSAPRSMAEMTRVGPFYEEARRIENMLGNPKRAALVLVTLPEALPVNESLELLANLGQDRDLLAAIVVNQVLQDPLPAGVPWPRLRQGLEASDNSGVQALLQVADGTADRFAAQRRAIVRLQEEAPALVGHPLPVPRLALIPHRPTLADLDRLAERLAAALEATP